MTVEYPRKVAQIATFVSGHKTHPALPATERKPSIYAGFLRFYYKNIALDSAQKSKKLFQNRNRYFKYITF